MKLTAKIISVLQESYNKKSLRHLYDSFWLFVYSTFKLPSLKKALKEQKLIPIGPKNVGPDRFPPDNPPKGGFAKNGKRQKALSVT